MKKPKVSLDLSKVKGFLINHAEKIVFAVFGLVFAWLAYGAVMRETYDKTPSDFTSLANNARSAIQNASFTPADAPPKVAMRTANLSPVLPGPETPIGKSEGTGLRRPQPELLAALDLRVSTGLGVIAYQPTQAEMLAIQRKQEEEMRKLNPGGFEGEGEFGEPGARPRRGRGRGGEEGMEGGFPQPGTRGSGGFGGRGGMGGGIEGERGYGPAPGAIGSGGFGGLGGRGMGMGPMGGFGPEGGMGGEGFMPPVYQPPPGSIPKGRPWASVTALVPIGEQMRKYQAAFKDARFKNPETDFFPNYAGFEIERKEVTPGTPDANPDEGWAAIDLKRALMEQVLNLPGGWNGQYTPLVAQEYTHPVLTKPVPPLYGKQPDDGMFTHPDIPMFDPTELQAGMMGEGMMPAQPELPVEGDKPAAEGPAVAEGAPPRNPAAPATPGATPLNPTLDDLFNAGGQQGAFFGGGMGMEGEGGYRGGGPGMPPGMGMGGRMGMGMGGMYGEGGAMTGQQMPDHVLFRFIDTTVQPGKSYRYRVRLVLANPNYRVQARYLDPSAKTEPKVSTAWSEPSATASVPYANDLRLGGSAGSDRAAVALIKWDAAKAISAVVETQAERGQVLNATSDTYFESPDEPGNVKKEKLSVDTQTLVADIGGGESIKVGRDSATAPVELLVRDADGNLALRSELVDHETYDFETKALKDREKLYREMNRPVEQQPEERGEGRGRGGRGES